MREIPIKDAPKFIKYLEYDNKYKEMLNQDARFFLNDDAEIAKGYYFLKKENDAYMLYGSNYEFYLKESFIDDVKEILKQVLDTKIIFNASFYLNTCVTRILRVYDDNENKEELFEDKLVIGEETKKRIVAFEDKIKSINAICVDSNYFIESHVSECNYEEPCEENNYRGNEYDEESNIHYEVRKYVISN